MSEMKHVNMRLPKELWVFLKTLATQKETTMMNIVNKCLMRYKKSIEKNVDYE